METNQGGGRLCRPAGGRREGVEHFKEEDGSAGRRAEAERAEAFQRLGTATRAKSAAKNVVAAAKRTVTRKLRNTMGKKQKETVKASGSPIVSSSNGVVSITPSAASTSSRR